jgi:hypothetical protein
LDIHHIVPRENGGSHEAWNLILACSADHQAIHNGRLHVSGTADQLVVRRVNDQSVPISAHPTAQPVAVEPSNEENLNVARGALVKMGFKSSQAKIMLEQASAHVGSAKLTELLRGALQHTR